MIKYQKNDKEIQEYVKRHKDHITIIKYIICDTKREKSRPIDPKELQIYIFERLHNVSQPGVKSTRSVIANRYVWKNINKDITLWAKSCIAFQRSKIDKHIKSPVKSFSLPSLRFDKLLDG